MAEFEHRINSGTMFKNDRKTSANSPDYTGNANIEGEIYRVAGWIKTARTGNKFLSLAFSLPNEYQSGSPQDNSFDDDIPF